jgi:hypothetical protein
MDGVGPGIAGLGEDLFGFDDLVDLGLERLLHVDDVDARRPDAGDDQVTPFQKRVAGQRRQRRGTGVPAEMVKLVARVGHDDLMHDLAIGVGGGVHVHDRQPVGLRAVRTEHQREGQRFHRGLHGDLGCGVECRIRPKIHGFVLPLDVRSLCFRLPL